MFKDSYVLNLHCSTYRTLNRFVKLNIQFCSSGGRISSALELAEALHYSTAPLHSIDGEHFQCHRKLDWTALFQTMEKAKF
jgi:hypothetical protein